MMIRFEGISHSYENKKVLNHFDLQIEAKGLTCLLGGSGCGKTTILRLIAGLETPDEGKIFIANNIASAENKILIEPYKRNIGFIFQDLALWPHLTVYKNIAFGLTERKEKNVKEKVYEMLKFFGLENYSDKYPHQLSGGEKQLVAISRSLVLKPEILLMDEPLANLDVKLKRKIIEHIENLKSKFELTIVYVTHDHKEAFAIADKILVMDEGKIVASGTVDEIKKSENKFVKYFLEF